MRQSDHEYEERSFGDIQRAIDFENSMNDLESQLYYRRLSPKEVAQQVCIIYAVTHGYLASVPVEQVAEFEKRLEEHMDNYHADVLEAIRTTGKLETDTETALKAALDELVSQFTA